MNCVVPPSRDTTARAQPWHMHVLSSVDSTNTYAARLPAWSAIRADVQTGGRGRTPDRAWISDRGGLWLSAVLPCSEPRSKWEILPLAAGWAVLASLREIGVSVARLRWPNDVMVGPAKLAGVLVERFTNETAVVGIGVNIHNAPENGDPSLAGHTARLSDLVCTCHSVEHIAERILRMLAQAHELVVGSGCTKLALELNATWAPAQRVNVTLREDRRTIVGEFEGIDAEGCLLLRTESTTRAYAARDVLMLRELH